jgi:hypothetical protein
MVAEAWRDLCRFDDGPLARAVATSIASMEFEVRLDEEQLSPPALAGHDRRQEATRRFVVRVRQRHWLDLADVLDEIIGEQREFDRQLAERHAAGRHVRVVAVIGLAGAADLILLLALMDW